MNRDATKLISVTSDWLTLPDGGAEFVSIQNKSGHAIQIRYAGDTGDGNLNDIDDKDSCGYAVIANANELEIKGTAASNCINLIYSL